MKPYFLIILILPFQSCRIDDDLQKPIAIPSSSPSNIVICYPDWCSETARKLRTIREEAQKCITDSDCIDPPTDFDYYFEYSCLKNEQQLINKFFDLSEYDSLYDELNSNCVSTEMCPMLVYKPIEYRCIHQVCQ